jgi:hypothetical protein
VSSLAMAITLWMLLLAMVAVPRASPPVITFELSSDLQCYVRHCCGAHRCFLAPWLLCRHSFVQPLSVWWRLFDDFRPTSVWWLPFDVRQTSIGLPSNFVHQRSSIDVHPLTSVRCCSFPSTHRILQIICTTYICSQYHIFQTISNVLYFYKNLGHGTTPCLQIMKALSFSQRQSISYETTCNHLSRFIWTHNLHDGTIKCLQRHRHIV